MVRVNRQERRREEDLKLGRRENKDKRRGERTKN